MSNHFPFDEHINEGIDPKNPNDLPSTTISKILSYFLIWLTSFEMYNLRGH